jgi:hypothetical protein
MAKHIESTPPSHTTEPESMAELRGDCARMAPHWPAGTSAQTAAEPDPERGREREPEPVSPSRFRGITVPPASAHLLDGMSEYGD